MKVLIASAVIAGLLALSATTTAAAEPTCAAALTVTEKIVCASEVLGKLDQRLSRLYGWLVVSLGERERAQLVNEQRLFLAFRDVCGGDAACLRASYLTRIDDLAARLRVVTLGPDVS